MNKDFKNIVLKTENLTIGYHQKKGNNIVFSNINLSLKKGKFISVLGKNGIGKSTFLRTISKVQKPLNGTILLNDKILSKYSEKELSTKLSLVLTERLPDSQLTVFELIALGRQPYTNWLDKLSETDYNKVNIAIEQTGITHLKNKRFYELSDGQLQRVLIARALAQDTEIIILDEPTAHLDLHQTIRIFKLLKQLVSKTDKTIIISTHQVNLAIKLSDEIVVFTEENLYCGSPKELILHNAFENLFPKDLINFNKSLEQFVIN